MKPKLFFGVFQAFVDLEVQELFGKPREAEGIGKDTE